MKNLKSQKGIAPIIAIIVFAVIITGVFTYYLFHKQINQQNNHFANQPKLVYGKPASPKDKEGDQLFTITTVGDSPNTISFQGWAYIPQPPFIKGFVLHENHDDQPEAIIKFSLFDTSLNKKTISLSNNVLKSQNDPIYLPSLNAILYLAGNLNQRNNYQLLLSDIGTGKTNALFNASSSFTGSGYPFYISSIDNNNFVYFGGIQITIDRTYYGTGIIKYDLTNKKIVKVFQNILGTSVSISPDGQKAASSTYEGDGIKLTIHITDLKSGKNNAISVGNGLTTSNDNSLIWSPNSSKLVYLHLNQDIKGPTQLSYVSLMDNKIHDVASFATSPGSIRIIGWLDNDSFAYVIITTPNPEKSTAYIFNTATSTRQQLSNDYGDLIEVFR